MAFRARPDNPGLSHLRIFNLIVTSKTLFPITFTGSRGLTQFSFGVTTRSMTCPESHRWLVTELGLERLAQGFHLYPLPTPANRLAQTGWARVVSEPEA